MGVEWLFGLLGFFAFFGGIFYVSPKLGSKRTVFVYLIAVLFILVGNFGSDVFVPALTKTTIGSTMGDTYKSAVLLFAGILGLAFMTQLRSEKSEDIGYSLGLGGSILSIVGVIGLASNQGNEVRFGVSLVALLVVIFLFYQYRDAIVEPASQDAQKK